MWQQQNRLKGNAVPLPPNYNLELIRTGMEGGQEEVSLVCRSFLPFFPTLSLNSNCCFANLPSFFFFFYKSYTANSFCLLKKNQTTNFYWEKKEGNGVASIKKKQISGNRNLSLSVT